MLNFAYALGGAIGGMVVKPRIFFRNGIWFCVEGYGGAWAYGRSVKQAWEAYLNAKEKQTEKLKGFFK